MRAYTAAGSFLRWAWEARGPQWIARVYATSAAQESLPLVPDYLRFLDGLAEPPRAVALASQQYSAPAIVRKRCAHEVAALRREALAARDPRRSAELWAKCAELSPDDPALLVALRRAQLAARDESAAQATLSRALGHRKLSQPLRAQILVDAGDTAWKAGTRRARSPGTRKPPACPARKRRSAASRSGSCALRDPPSWPALRPLLAEANNAPEILLHIRDSDLSRPRDGLAAYLLAKQMQNRGAWPECAAFSASALSRELPGPLFVQEALRMRGIAAWHLGDRPAALAAFGELGKGAPPGRALEVRRWIIGWSDQPRAGSRALSRRCRGGPRTASG